MKTIEYKQRFLEFMKGKGVNDELADIELEATIECNGYSDDPEDDAQEALYAWSD